MDLTPTACVILGMVDESPRTGYEIKAYVDHSTRFFWAASYGQIYPELKRLEHEGLVEGTEDSTGGRKRRRYSITADGRKALQAWLREPPAACELRDEGLLKLYFSAAVSPEEAANTLREMRRQREAMIATLRDLESKADATGRFPSMVLEGGLALHQSIIDWTLEMEAKLTDPTPEEAKS